jgi:hypothetical protein
VRLLGRLERSEDVYLVDLSVEDYSRNDPRIVDVSQTDVYWLLEGWDG